MDIRCLAAIVVAAAAVAVVQAKAPESSDPARSDRQQAQEPRPLYLNPDADAGARARDLVSRMTIDEKIPQLMNAAPAIPRLGVPAYEWWNECLHGVARAGLATVFPQAIGLAATFDVPLISEMAEVIGNEARAKHHQFERQGQRGRYQGLTFWSPNINIIRDPRWGRGQETYGEDPFLTGRVGVAFVKGLQGDDPRYYRVIATAKHYAVHSGPEPDRHTFDARPTERDLWDTYLPAFRELVQEAKVASVMSAYNRIDGESATASDRFLNEILRRQWGFTGYVVSDCGAVYDIFRRHKIVPTAEEGTALALTKGCDLECGNSFRALKGALEKGLVKETDLDLALERLFVARIKLGMFDPPNRVRWAQVPYTVNDAPEHNRLARRVAQASVVLLKNTGVLPLRKDLGSIAVIGPTADDLMSLLGNYNGTPARPVWMQRRYDEALAVAREAQRLDPDHPIITAALWNAYDRKGMEKEALEAAKANVRVGYGDPRVDAALDEGYARGGYAEAMRRVAEALVARFHEGLALASDTAAFYAMTGDKDKAIEWLEKGLEARDPVMPYIGVFPSLDDLLPDPRFQELLRKMRLPADNKSPEDPERGAPAAAPLC